MKISDYKVSEEMAETVDKLIKHDLTLEEVSWLARLAIMTTQTQGQKPLQEWLAEGLETATHILAKSYAYAAQLKVERDALAKELEAGVMAVLCIRCTKHYKVPQINTNEHSGGECGACIAEERDALARQVESMERGGGQ